MATASNEMTEHAENAEATYKPSEHDGLKKDGTPDKRMSSDHGELRRPSAFSPFCGVSSCCAREAAAHCRRGRKPTLTTLGNLTTGFGGDKQLAHDAGVKGGKTDAEDMAYN